MDRGHLSRTALPYGDPPRDYATAHRPSPPYLDRTPLRYQRPAFGSQCHAEIMVVSTHDIKKVDAYLSSSDPEQRIELARAAHANLTAGLSWWRAMEVFSLRWAYVAVTEPGDMDPLLTFNPSPLACCPRPSRTSLA
jgi:hypothetical protein